MPGSPPALPPYSGSGASPRLRGRPKSRRQTGDGDKPPAPNPCSRAGSARSSGWARASHKAEAVQGGSSSAKTSAASEMGEAETRSPAIVTVLGSSQGSISSQLEAGQTSEGLAGMAVLPGQEAELLAAAGSEAAEVAKGVSRGGTDVGGCFADLGSEDADEDLMNSILTEAPTQLSPQRIDTSTASDARDIGSKEGLPAPRLTPVPPAHSAGTSGRSRGRVVLFADQQSLLAYAGGGDVGSVSLPSQLPKDDQAGLHVKVGRANY